MAREVHLGHKELHAIVDIVCEHQIRVLRQLVSFTLQNVAGPSDCFAVRIKISYCSTAYCALIVTPYARTTTDCRLLFRTTPLRDFFYNDRCFHHYWRTRILVKILNQTWCCLRIKMHDDLGINRAHLILM